MNEFNKITRTYNIISDMKKNKVTEADIKGVDELVYNPVTKKGGIIGYGYDKGQRKEGITWSGHDNHLHIAFTDRNVAMDVIDKADSMGLITTENPYAKKDPNKKIDNHTGGSLHYDNFPGTPKVGKAADITGTQSKITELIRWVESKYANGANQSNEPEDDKPSEEEGSGGYLSSIAGNMAKAIMPVGASINVMDMLGLKEDIDRIKELLK
jgi:hypothetical protein